MLVSNTQILKATAPPSGYFTEKEKKKAGELGEIKDLSSILSDSTDYCYLAKQLVKSRMCRIYLLLLYAA